MTRGRVYTKGRTAALAATRGAVPATLIEYLVVPTIVTDADHKVRVWNKACELLTGVPADQVLGTRNQWQAFYLEPRPCLADLIIAGRDHDIATLYSSSCKFGLSEFGVSVENWCDLRHAHRRAYLAIDAGPVFADDGRITFVVETLRDITVQKEAQVALARLAAIDGLTGLSNRRVFDETLEREARRCGHAALPMSLLIIDIDHFKSFNDHYGHTHGDACLKRVAQAIGASMLRPTDVAARYGGEEFGVILPNVDVTGARVIAERIRLAVEDLAIAHDASTAAAVVSVSVGLATVSCADAQTLLNTADRALYDAKRKGRNRISIFGTATEPLRLQASA